MHMLGMFVQMVRLKVDTRKDQNGDVNVLPNGNAYASYLTGNMNVSGCHVRDGVAYCHE